MLPRKTILQVEKQQVSACALSAYAQSERECGTRVPNPRCRWDTGSEPALHGRCLLGYVEGVAFGVGKRLLTRAGDVKGDGGGDV